MAERVFKNRKAYFHYEIVDTLEAGIQLLGTEIKSIRDGKVSFNDAHCIIDEGEMYVRGLHIAEYKLGTNNNHNPVRNRKLLLNKKEINQWNKKVSEKGFTIIPVRLVLNNKGLAKLIVALGRGKKLYDKRDSLKTKDVKRDIDRAFKY